METSCAVIELLPNTTERVREWAEFLRTNREEAIQSLKNEGVTVESAFVVNIDGKDYLVAYMRAVSMDNAHEAVVESTLNVDAYHQTFKKTCLGRRYQGTLVSDLSRISDEVGHA